MKKDGKNQRSWNHKVAIDWWPSTSDSEESVSPQGKSGVEAQHM